MTAADLGQRAPRGEPGRDRDAQQVEHVGDLGLDRAPACTGAPAQVQIGREEAGRGRGEQQREPEPAGRIRGEDGARREPGRRRAGLDRHHVAGGNVEAGSPDPRLQRSRGPQTRAAAQPGERRDEPRRPDFARRAVAPSRCTQREHVGPAVGRQDGRRGGQQGRRGHGASLRIASTATS